MILKRSHDVNGPDEELGKMRRANRIPITELNQHITCTLCKGYFIDATTIIECLHTFCRSCIVKYLETNKYCPVCDVQVHKSKPLVNIRPDKTLQDVVYKLVPRLFQNEMQRRREFYIAHPEVKPSGLEQRGEASYQHLLTPEETICLSLNYHESTGPPRYLRCPAAVSVVHLQKLIRAKYDLSDAHRIDILHNQDTLHSYLTLMDVAYIYLWRRKGPLELTYRIYENRTKRLKTDDKEKCEEEEQKKSQDDDDDISNNTTNNNNNWKEVQLRISENGEISVTDIQDTAELKRTVNDSELPEINYVIQSSTTPSAITTTSSTTNESTLPLANISSILSEAPVVETTESTLTTEAVTSVSVAGPLLSPTLAKPEQENAKSTTNSVTNTITETISTEPVVTTSLDIKTSTVATMETNPIVTSTSTTITTSHVTGNTPTECVNVNSTVNTDTLSSSPICTTTNVISSQNVSKTDDKSTFITAISKPICLAITKTVTATNTMSVATVSNSVSIKLDDQYKLQVTRPENKVLKHKLDSRNDVRNDGEPPAKQPKQTILNHTLGLHKLSNNHPLKKHSQMSNEIVVVSGPKPSILEVIPAPTIINKTLNTQPSRPGTPATHKWKSSAPGPPCYMPKTTYTPIINVPKVQTSVSKMNDHKQPIQNTVKISEQKNTVQLPQATQPNTLLNSKPMIKTKPSTPIGYKTLRDPPKTWNPQISRANLNRCTSDAKCTELKNVRPPKFFKLRNNMPRYLGNPASGVKPMYQVHLSPEKEKMEQKQDKSEIKKHSIVKIDPKTLKPISERAPETSNLSRTSETKFSEQDLKINISSVPIFNPLKLQSSPKSDRKSPKSPHSPKNKSSSPPNRREKLNLNFTPPNPFIPNLTSPTMNPNQFLFSSGPPGFPSYDPRVMAAYHTFLYGQQRMPFNPAPIPGLNLDLNQRTLRDNFDLVSQNSPKIVQNKPPTVTQPSTSVASTSNTHQHNSHKNNLKKGKESGKNEKSLQNAVEKLTQNKIKEVAKLESSEKDKTSDCSRGTIRQETSLNALDNAKSVDNIKLVDAKVKEDDRKVYKESKNASEKKTNENSDTNNIKDKVQSKLDKESGNNNVDSACSITVDKEK